MGNHPGCAIIFLMKKSFLAIDSNAIVHRAYHAYPSSLVTSSGTQVNAVFGFTAMLLQALEKFKPDYVLATFDTGKPTFRHAQYSEYKATRKPMDNELSQQFPLVYQIVEALNIPILKKDGFEADDLLGSIANKVINGSWNSQNLDLYILSGDKDLFALVGENVKVCLPQGSFRNIQIYDREGVYEKMGVYPEQISDFKAIVGDASDNIPGVKGVGVKTAVELLGKLYTLGGIYEALDQVKPRVAKILKEGVEQAYFSKELAEIKTDVEIGLKLEACLTKDFDRKKVQKLFFEFEFRSLMNKIPQSIESETEERFSGQKQQSLFVANGCQVNDEKIEEGIDALKDATKLVFFYGGKERACISKWRFISNRGDLLGDTEGLYVMHNDGRVIHTDKNIGRIINIGANKERETAFYGLEDYVSRQIQEEMLGVGNIHDIQLMGHCLSSGEKSYELPALVSKWLKQYLPDDFDYGNKKQVLDYIDQVALKQKEVYKTSDFLREIEFVRTIENKFSIVLGKMESNGIKIDSDYLIRLEREIDKEILEIKEKIFYYVGHEFNPDSPKQVAQILYNELGIEQYIPKRRGQSTRESVLQEIKDLHPFIPELLKYRAVSKMKSTYITGFINLFTTLYDNGKKIDISTAKIREGSYGEYEFFLFTDFLQTGTSSGRLSSQNPNLQNIPIQGEWADKFRNIFLPREGCKMVSIDYSQIEYRLMADFSKDDNLISYFESGADIHRATASEIFAVEESEVTDDQRRVGKIVNFGILYGQTAYGLSKQLGISVSDASKYIEKYFAKYSKVAKYIDRLKKDATERGYVETVLGRRRYISGIDSRNRFLREASLREAINTPIQGSASDLMKIAMINADDLIEKEFKGKARMLLQVHDELIFEVEKDEINRFEEKIVGILKNAGKELGINIPLGVHFSSGDNMAEVK